MWFEKKRIYADYASATPLLPEAARAMREAEKLVGNPGAIHAEGVAAKAELNRAREIVARELGCKAREIVFTSGLTESNNLAILGYARALERVLRGLSGTHWVVSSIEHDSVLECFSEIERQGGRVTHINPNTNGLFTAEIVQRALTPETVFVSIGWANNEIGTIQPLSAISRAVSEYEQAHGTTIIVHADAGQGPLYLGTSVHTLGVDLLSLGSAKLYGPHGVGALYIKNRVDLSRVLLGGAQERGLRAGTENVALAVGFATAYAHIACERSAESKRLSNLRDALARELESKIPGFIINGSTSLTAGGNLKHVLPHMLNISIPDVQSEYVTLALDHAGVAISTKSACREGEEKQSHVVAALGGDPPAGGWRAQNTFRISLGRETTESDVRRIAEAVSSTVHLSRK